MLFDLIVNRDIFSWSEKEKQWKPAGYSLPEGCAVVDGKGRDNGLRFVDLNGDGYNDVFQSNDAGCSIHLWAGKVKDGLGWKRGWSHVVRTLDRAGADALRIPPFVRDGQDNGAWFRDGHAVWQNEETFKLEAHTLRRPFKDLIAFDVPPPLSPQDSLAAMRPRPGFTVELVAAEPVLMPQDVADVIAWLRAK